MSKEYLISEFAAEFEVSVNTAWKWIKKQGLNTELKNINNRDVNVVILSDEEYKNLYSKKFGKLPGEANTSANETNNDMNEYFEDAEYEHINTNQHTNPMSQQLDTRNIIESVMNYSKDMNNHIKEYIDRIINAESQIRLLEDSERRKDAEYLSLVSNNKILNEQVNEAKENIHNLENELKLLRKRNIEMETKNNRLKKENETVKKESDKAWWNRRVF